MSDGEQPAQNEAEIDAKKKNVRVPFLFVPGATFDAQIDAFLDRWAEATGISRDDTPRRDEPARDTGA